MLHLCIDKVRDAYNNEQYHGITPIHGKEWLSGELRWVSQEKSTSDPGMALQHCGQYVSWEARRLLLAVSMGSIYV